MITIKQYGRLFHFEEEIDEKLSNYLFKTLSYMKKNAHFLPNPIFGLVNLYNKKKRIFPVGLLDKAKWVLDAWKKNTGEDYTIVYSQPKYKAKLNKFLDLRYYQNDALESLINGGIVVLPTGAGKSLLGVRYLECCPDEAQKVIVVPTRDLQKQWEEQVKHIKNIRIATYQKLYRELDKLDIYDFVIFDECHHVSAKTIYKVGMGCKNATMIGLTATPKRDDGEDMKLYAVMGNIVYQIGIEQLVKEGFLIQAKVHMIDVPHREVGPMEEYRDIVINHIVNNDERNEKIKHIALKECENGSTIIMVDLIEHGEKLLKMFDKCGKKVVFVNGQSKDRDDIFKKAVADHYDIIIATKVYGEGVSINCLKTMILAGGGKGTTKIVQQVGRMLRSYNNKTNAIIYDFKDNCKNLKAHVNKRLQIYKDNGFEVIDNAVEI